MTDDASRTTRPRGEAVASGPGARSLFWASAGFYALIAFEFFYMASPFATYFYSVYGPGMDVLQGLGFADWTLWFFLPHIVEDTRSPIVDHAETLGLILFLGGLAAFALGAVQVYRAKLLGRGAVTGGLYAAVRHPQYAALIAASLGMLLLWPRFLVLFATVAVIFTYVLLARAEEAICLRRFPGYAAYRARTGMFAPRSWTRWWPDIRFVGLPRLARVLIWVTAFCAVLAVATVAAFGLRALTIASFHTHRTADGVYLSVADLPDGDLARIARIAGSAPPVRAALEPLPSDGAVIAYVLPTGMYVSEIPMHLPEGERFGHAVPRDRDFDRYKVVFTQALFGPGGLPAAGDVLAHAVNKRPLVEVRVNLGANAVEATFPPPGLPFYGERQVPVF